MKLRLLFLLIAAASFAMLTACGSSGKPSVTLSGVPSTLAPGGTATITATVAHDSNNGGVVYSLACTTTGQCGSFSTTGVIASGASVTYQAPTSALSGIVTITATAVDNTQVFAASPVTVGPPSATLPDGNYVFRIFGVDANGVLNVGGAFTVASGAITGGEQDFVDNAVTAFDGINGATSSITPSATATDGNLTIVLDTGDTNLGPGGNGLETLSLAVTSSAAATNGPGGLLTWFDTFGSGSGSLRFQNSTAAMALPSAGYAFTVAGLDGGGFPLAIGGIINVDGPGTISGTGSEFDINDDFSSSLDQGFGASTVAGPSSAPTAPDSFGRVEFSLVPSGATAPFAFGGYIIDSSRIVLVENDNNLGAWTSGIAFSQGINTDTFSNTTADFGGTTYVIGATGIDVVGPNTFAGNITFNPTTGSTNQGTISGLVDYNNLTDIVSQAAITTGNYTIDPTGFVTVTDLTFAGSPAFSFQFYLDGNGNAVAASMDSFEVTAGPAYQATAGASIFGAYALGAGGFSAATGNPWSAVGQADVNGANSIATTTPPAFTDFNYFDFGTPADSIEITAVPLTGTVVAGASMTTGLGADSVLANDLTSDTFDLYVIDANRAFGIESDDAQTGLLYFEYQDPTPF